MGTPLSIFSSVSASSDDFGCDTQPLASPGAVVTQGSQASSRAHLQVSGGLGLLEVYTSHCWRPPSPLHVFSPNPLPQSDTVANAAVWGPCHPVPCSILASSCFQGFRLLCGVWLATLRVTSSSYLLYHPSSPVPSLSLGPGGPRALAEPVVSLSISI